MHGAGARCSRGVAEANTKGREEPQGDRTQALSSSTQSSNNPLLSPPKEKLKAFFWEKSRLLRPLLFTFGRIAIGGEFKHRKRPLGYRKSCRQVWKTCRDAVEMHLPLHEQPWDQPWVLASTLGNQPSTISWTSSALPFLKDVVS